MKIERISENQIRCTLSNMDLSVRNLNLSELAYGSEKARNLFREMIQRASNEVGFEADDIPLMVEAIPLANESVMLIITKVEDPEELDTRFSKFSQSEEDLESAYGNFPTELLDGAEMLKNALTASEKQGAVSETVPEPPKEEDDKSRMSRIFRFSSLDLVCAAAKAVGSDFKGYSVLYKNIQNGQYYLVLKRGDASGLSFGRICNALSEYGTRLEYDAVTEAHYEEHYDVIVKRNALSSLAKL